MKDIFSMMGAVCTACKGGSSSSIFRSWSTFVLLVLLGLLMSVVVPGAEGGGYADSLKAASLVMQEKITVEPNVTAPTNNTVGGLPYRTAYHFQPKGHWMNDPNGPTYYKGYYHLFYQYNPNAAIPGTIEWGHVVSKDLIHWEFLESAIKRDHWYDLNGCWSGSVSFLDNGTPVILYTGNSDVNAQSQNKAVPADPSDPLLRKWVKDPNNPIAQVPPGYNKTEFRDPTTAWKGGDGVWRILVGANYGLHGNDGTALMFKSTDFERWNYSHRLHDHKNTGMWECPDFYPVKVAGKKGLDPSTVGPHVRHVLKISSDDHKHDYYSVGKYLVESDTYEPENSAIDTGAGLRYDYGKYYASKTFFDPHTSRRILYGWSNESDSTVDDVAKGWACIQTVPRLVWLDRKTTTDLMQWPIKEVERLRHSKLTVDDVKLEAGTVVRLMDVAGVQLDIELSFEVPKVDQGATAPELIAGTGQLVCSQAGAAAKGVYGPFGVLVLATDDLKEQTAVYFYFVYSKQQGWKTLVCSDQSRSSVAKDLDKTTYGSYVRLYESEDYLTLRLLVDHSVVESFAQGGRTVITSRVYPQYAVGQKAHVFLFNNGSTPITAHKVEVWNMGTVKFVDFHR